MDKESFNKFENVPNLSYNILKYLMLNNETIFKLLYYTDANAWRNDVDHPNLTYQQKGALIYNGIIKETDARIFMDTGMDDSWQIEASMFRVSIAELIPTNYVFGYASVAIESYAHYKINTLTNHFRTFSFYFYTKKTFEQVF